ncbi:MAG: DUF4377 domain-containing protein [Chitinophagaceae bacterium]|nr:DUF4377 domain-containing protein [Chitinophagaceae bacterium]
MRTISNNTDYLIFKTGKIIFLCCFIFISIFLALGCKKNTDEKTAVFNVLPKLVYVAPLPPASPSLPANIPAMQIVVNGEKDTLHLTPNRIAGFTYTEGYKYVLKVRITKLNPAPADSDGLEYTLIEQLSKSQ